MEAWVLTAAAWTRVLAVVVEAYTVWATALALVMEVLVLTLTLGDMDLISTEKPIGVSGP